MVVISVQSNPSFVNITGWWSWTHEPSVHLLVLFPSCFTWSHMCTKCTIRLLRRGISCLPTRVLRGCVCVCVCCAVLLWRYAVWALSDLGLLIPPLKNPFQICFDIQLDLREPVGGCQPNLGLILAALRVRGFRGCACVSFMRVNSCQLTAVYWRFGGERCETVLSPGGLLVGFNGLPLPSFLWNIISPQTHGEHLFSLEAASVRGATHPQAFATLARPLRLFLSQGDCVWN